MDIWKERRSSPPVLSRNVPHGSIEALHGGIIKVGVMKNSCWIKVSRLREIEGLDLGCQTGQNENGVQFAAVEHTTATDKNQSR